MIDEYIKETIRKEISAVVGTIPQSKELFAEYPELLKIKDVQKMLDVKDASTIYALAKQNIIPNFRIGKEFRFVKQQLVAWMLAGGNVEIGIEPEETNFDKAQRDKIHSLSLAK